jgi:pimeloyl-ACP methyl ester carboxylesterase
MMKSEGGTSRRTVLAGLSGLAAGAFALGAAPADAAPAAAAGEKPVWSAQYWAAKGPVKLFVYRKRVGAPQPGAAPLPVLFLVHGSTMGGPSSYDLTVPGQTGYSMMDAFARYGYDVWTMDHEGYGRSSRTAGYSDIASGVEDLKAAMALVQRETGATKAHFFGESSGAIRASAFAAAAPERVDRLALAAYTWTGKGSPTLGDRAKNIEFFRTHNTRPATVTNYTSIFTRDKPGTADPRVGEAIYAVESTYGNTIPNGTYLDMTTKLPLVDPKTVHAPVMMARGEYDGIATDEDCLGFFQLLPNRDREFVIIPGAAHSLVLGYNRERYWFGLHAFLSPPPREDRLG